MMRRKKEELPLAIETPGVKLRALRRQGGMTISHYEIFKRTDFRPLIAGLPNDKCSVPHWGYVIKGKLTLEYGDGTLEKYEGGQVYYQPPGHTGYADGRTEMVEFSPDEQYARLLAHFKGKLDA